MLIRFTTNNPVIIDKVNAFMDEWHSDTDEIIVKTSGSTSTPKTIILSKSYMKASAIATGRFLNLNTGETALLCLSSDTIGGKMMIVRAIVLELELIVSDVNSFPLEEVNEKITFAAMVPMQVTSSLESSSDKLGAIEKLIIGGAPVSDNLKEKLQSLECIAYHTFGMTETISHIAMRKLNHPSEDYFTTLPGITIETTPNDCLMIKAPLLGIEQLITNDIVEIDGSQKFKWLGRSDFVVNSGGIKLHPEQIESTLSAFITSPFFVSGITDERLGEKLILNIEALNTTLEKKILVEALDTIKSPKEIHLYPKFRYTRSGKIDRVSTLKDSINVIRKIL